MYIKRASEYKLFEGEEVLHSYVWVNIDGIKEIPSLKWINNPDKLNIKGLIIHKMKLSSLGSIGRFGFKENEEGKKILYRFSNRYNKDFNWLAIDITKINKPDISDRDIVIIYSDNSLFTYNQQISIKVRLDGFKELNKKVNRIKDQSTPSISCWSI